MKIPHSGRKWPPPAPLPWYAVWQRRQFHRREILWFARECGRVLLRCGEAQIVLGHKRCPHPYREPQAPFQAGIPSGDSPSPAGRRRWFPSKIRAMSGVTEKAAPKAPLVPTSSCTVNTKVQSMGRGSFKSSTITAQPMRSSMALAFRKPWPNSKISVSKHTISPWGRHGGGPLPCCQPRCQCKTPSA